MMPGRYVRTMRGRRATTLVAILLAATVLCAGQASAQGAGGPLTVQGLHQQDIHSVAARAFGGVTIGSTGDVGLMFVNPAAMHAPGGLQVSVAGYRQARDRDQVQQFAPVRYYPNLSLLLENRTDGIPDPDPDLVGFTPADTVQRPFDDIPPHWSHSNTSDVPLHALLAVPFSLGDVTLTAGIGAVRYADLDHYYQNNNVLSPGVLEQRPLPTLRPTDDDPVRVDWYQATRSREGSINGYGMALAGHVERYDLTLGVSGLLLNGSTDDVEQRFDRGELTFFANEFRADSSVGHLTKTGTSDFSGFEFTVSSTLHSQYVDVGFTVSPPTTYDRSYEMEVEGDTSGVPFTASESGDDQFQLPWRGTVGLLLKPSEKLHIGLEYEFRPYGSATFTGADGEEASPWHSASLFRIGTRYDLFPWLVLRGGIRGEADVFVPDGSAFVDDPVVYRVYAAGIGLHLGGVRWHVTYENADMTYQDIWGSAISMNTDVRHTLVTGLSYTFQAVP